MDKHDPQPSPVRPLLIASNPQGKGVSTSLFVFDHRAPEVRVELPDLKGESFTMYAHLTWRTFHA